MPARAAREGNRGTALSPGRPAHTPSAGSSDKPLPGLPPPYGLALPQVAPQVSRTEPISARPGTPLPLRKNPGRLLDTDSKEDSIWTAILFVGVPTEDARNWAICTLWARSADG